MFSTPAQEINEVAGAFQGMIDKLATSIEKLKASNDEKFTQVAGLHAEISVNNANISKAQKIKANIEKILGE